MPDLILFPGKKFNYSIGWRKEVRLDVCETGK